MIKYPNILIFTDEIIDMSHGTGVVLLKHFAGYPKEKLANVCLHKTGQNKPELANTFLIPPEQLALERLKDAHLTSIRWLEETGFRPNLVYSNFFSARGLLVLRQFLNTFQYPLPAIQHFQDFRHDKVLDMENEIFNTSDILSEIWAVTDSIAERLSVIVKHPVPVVSSLCTDIPADFKKEHSELNQNTRAVMLGNIWLPQGINDIQCAWKWVRSKTLCENPVSWICHPSTIQRITGRGFTMDGQIEWRGFLPEDTLFTELIQSDFAIVPVNRKKKSEDDYAAYSLPSRITELSAAGLPIFFAAGPDTETWQFVSKTGIGTCSYPEDKIRFRSDLLEFMRNVNLRKECGIRARRLAESQFDLKSRRKLLFNKFDTICRSHTHQALKRH